MFISSETKAAIGQWQRSCSDFPCSIHFDFMWQNKNLQVAKEGLKVWSP